MGRDTGTSQCALRGDAMLGLAPRLRTRRRREADTSVRNGWTTPETHIAEASEEARRSREVGSGLSRTAKGGGGGRRQDTSSEVNLSKDREGDYSMGGDESIRPERAGKAEREGGREWNPPSIHNPYDSTQAAPAEGPRGFACNPQCSTGYIISLREVAGSRHCAYRTCVHALADLRGSLLTTTKPIDGHRISLCNPVSILTSTQDRPEVRS